MYGDTSAVDERFLAPLGVHRIAVPVPFIEAGGPVNVYALKNPDDSFTLFDAGLGTPDALVALRVGAQEAGVDLRQVSRIIVSHGHIDHFGNAQQLADESGARIWVHPADLDKVLGTVRSSRMVLEHTEYFVRLGVPQQTLNLLLEGGRQTRTFARPVDREKVDLLSDSQRFDFKHFTATVMHTPGHTPGLVCLHVPEHRLLFADDHLLARVSPNPVLDLSQGEGETKFLSLVRYVQSAKQVYALELDCVLPGHGEAFVGHRSLLDGLFEFYGRRQKKLLERLAKGPATIFELLEAIFVRRDVPRLLLMISEVLANVEVLELNGQVTRYLDGATWRFAALP
jgi:glyoxylase-like metal-dependent hydrolase (beta-lactamase superfamily II)